MLLLLMRHGIAEDGDELLDDFLRPLSPAGRKKTARAAAGLKTLVPGADAIVSSPKLRARQTAQLARDEWGKGAPPITEWPEMLEIFDFTPLHHKLRGLNDKGIATAFLVGHEPNLSLLASWLLADDIGAFGWDWKKAGALALDLDFEGEQSRVRWFVPPKVLRALGK